jgi:hypothetical protein
MDLLSSLNLHELPEQQTKINDKVSSALSTNSDIRVSSDFSSNMYSLRSSQLAFANIHSRSHFSSDSMHAAPVQRNWSYLINLTHVAKHANVYGTVLKNVGDKMQRLHPSVTKTKHRGIVQSCAHYCAFAKSMIRSKILWIGRISPSLRRRKKLQRIVSRANMNRIPLPWRTYSWMRRVFNRLFHVWRNRGETKLIVNQTWRAYHNYQSKRLQCMS